VFNHYDWGISKLMGRKLDIGVAAALMVISVAVFWESLSMPPAFYDPIGPAAFPRALSVTIFFLSIILIIKALRLPAGKTIQASRQSAHRLRPDLTVGSAVLSGIYILLLTLRQLSFAVSTTLYLISVITLLMPFDLKRLLIAIIIALIMGFGGGYIFTHVFYIDFP
jgi:putative tricarboxylic transport membrane protein